MMFLKINKWNLKIWDLKNVGKTEKKKEEEAQATALDQTMLSKNYGENVKIWGNSPALNLI